MLYGLPEGAFENRQNNKDPAGIVVVWEAMSCQSARPGRQQRLWDGVSACTPAMLCLS